MPQRKLLGPCNQSTATSPTFLPHRLRPRHMPAKRQDTTVEVLH